MRNIVLYLVFDLEAFKVELAYYLFLKTCFPGGMFWRSFVEDSEITL